MQVVYLLVRVRHGGQWGLHLIYFLWLGHDTSTYIDCIKQRSQRLVVDLLHIELTVVPCHCRLFVRGSLRWRQDWLFVFEVITAHDSQRYQASNEGGVAYLSLIRIADRGAGCFDHLCHPVIVRASPLSQSCIVDRLSIAHWHDIRCQNRIIRVLHPSRLRNSRLSVVLPAQLAVTEDQPLLVFSQEGLDWCCCQELTKLSHAFLLNGVFAVVLVL